MSYFLWCKQPPSAPDRLTVEGPKRHKIRHTQTPGTTPSVRVISPSKRPLPTQHTTNTRDEHPCRQRDSNPRSQQQNGRRPTLQTARPQKLAELCKLHTIRRTFRIITEARIPWNILKARTTEVVIF